MKTVGFVIGTMVLLATLMVVPAGAQCPTCNIAAGSTTGTCSRPANVTCSSDADCVAAAVVAQCPCDGQTTPSGQITPWNNHGQYVSCVSRFRNGLKKQGCLTRKALGAIQSCSANSTCGRKNNAVLCCKVSTGTCSDTTPGDGSKDGVCSNKGTIACDTANDCTVVKGPTSWTHNEAWCTNHGGYVSGTGSKCSACATPIACCVAPSTCAVVSTASCSSPAPGTSVPSCSGVTCP